ncbi:OmpA family protein [Rhodocytophaga rosea]|uniref:OmpA family protein n=1 Tax=Rhodocytophaga rosea TaxID=2704465 RepID=A0A6C0GKL1_9BACT|nr:OmpA family protein [Rhodocytophaga rosea]QHT68192.1 OmpA family protein [Rhodocytophaga rosea]
MKKILFLAFLLTSLFTTYAQEVQWASRVVAFSSEYQDPKMPKQYGAAQVTGKPSKLPLFGNSPCAWRPSQDDNASGEWIKVAYIQPQSVKQIAIAENMNAGTITRIYAYDLQDKEYLLFENKKDTSRMVGRMFNVFVKETTYKVAAIKIMMNTSRIKGVNQIDAIGISSSSEPVEARINISKNASTQAATQVKRENLGRNVNSPYDEICPVISPDGKSLYFTRAMHPGNLTPDQDIWVAQIDARGMFGPAKNLGAPINTIQHNSSFSISPDGNTMLLNNRYMPDGKLKKGLSITRRMSNGEWGFPEPVQINNYYNDNEYAEFSLAQNGKVLVMTAQRNDSYGSKDLYVSFLQPNNTWSEPKNMGAMVNTADGEISPFIASDGVSLYYSTGGLSGFGNMDVFVSKRLDDSWLNWSEPQNLGPAINSEAWDTYYTIPASGDYAYFVSDKESSGENDIFRIKLDKAIQPDPVALVYGNVYDAQTKQPLQASISYEALPKGGEAGSAVANPVTDGYKVVLPLKFKYSFTARAEGFMSAEEEIDLTQETAYKEIRKDLYLMPLAVGQLVRLNHIYFEQSKHALLETSFEELNRVAALMKENPTMEIQLEGHTDNVGDFMLNVDLSRNRVAAVKDYLVSKGIEEKRIQVKGYGSTRPVASNSNEKTRQQNRRVEFLILKK